MQYETLASYMEAFAHNRESGIVPVPLVAAHLGKTAPAVTGMIRTGRLDEIKIGRDRFVSLKSLLDMEAAYERQVSTVMKYLMETARSGVNAIFYEPIMAEVGMKPSIPADRTKIGQILGEISRRTKDDRKVLLSVLVHQKTAGVTGPGKGFFALATDLGYQWDDDQAFVAQETKKVIDAYRGS